MRGEVQVGIQPGSHLTLSPRHSDQLSTTRGGWPSPSRVRHRSPTEDGTATAAPNLATLISDYPGYSYSCACSNDGTYASGLVPNGSNGSSYAFFDDISSLQQKVTYAASKGFGGITYWTIGGEPNAPAGQSFFQMIRASFPRQ